MSELKPCPFCGGKAELICVPGYRKTGLSSSGWLVKCLNGCVNQMPYGSDHDAVQEWNRRAEERPERKPGKWVYGEDEYGIDGYHCDNCGFFVPWDYTHKFINYIEDYHYCPNCGAKMEG